MTELLSNINNPRDLKSLSIDELNNLAEEIREFLIDKISKTGGHLASNLGVVELSLALHYHLNSPRDKIVWDVGHQSYTHKILTGRKDKFDTLRQYGGLSGYPKFKESIHDIIETGHSATSISSALGLALARDLKKRKDKIYAVIGDGALTGGMAFEALNHAGHIKSNLKVILNDNEMSISPNVGALSHYLSKIRTEPAVARLKEDLEFLVNRIPRIGSTVNKTIQRVKNGLKYVFISGVLFEEMGFTYLGPIDGHNVEELLTNFKKADKIDGPVLIHINTVKGKGYRPAENEPSKYHGVGTFKIENGESLSSKESPTYSQIFGQTLDKIGKDNEKIVGITAAMPAGTGLDIFGRVFPERLYDVGIAEQHAVTLGAGLARGGMKPFVALYSSFLQRAYDQLIHDVCIQNLPVTIGIDRAGIVGNDGETHQGLFDFSFLRPIPNIVVMAPKDENELQHMLYTASEYQGPVAVRYPRGEGYGIKLDNEFHKIPIGEAEVLREGEQVLIIGIGSRVYPALEAASILEQEGIEVGVINARFLKPFGEELLREKFTTYNKILTVEEHVLKGGFGSSVLEFVNDNNIQGIEVERIGVPDEFVPQGDMEMMRKHYGLDSQSIVDKVKVMLKEMELEV